MRLTPLEISRHEFRTRWRGLDPEEVYAFLETVVADFEEVVRENARLRSEAEQLARDLDGLRKRERTLQDTLTTAQTVVDQLRRTAIKEAEVKVSEAEVQAESLLRNAETRRDQVVREVSELSQIRDRAEFDIRRRLESYLQMLDALREARSEADELRGRKARAG
jgi:cell division initiation protein